MDGGATRPTVLSGVREVEEVVEDNVDGDNFYNDGGDLGDHADGYVLVAVPLDENDEPMLDRSPHIVGVLSPGDDGAAVIRELSTATLRRRQDGGGGGVAGTGGTMSRDTGGKHGTLMRNAPSSMDDVAEEELAIAAGEPYVIHRAVLGCPAMRF